VQRAAADLLLRRNARDYYPSMKSYLEPKADPALRTVALAGVDEPALQAAATDPALGNGVFRARLARGEREQAIEAMTRATHASAAVEPAGYLALLRGDARRAAQQFGDAIAALPSDAGERNVRSLTRGTLQVGLGRARYGAGELHDARTALRQALAVLEPLTQAHRSARMERLVGRAQVALADTLRAMAATPAEIASVEASAAAWRVRAGLADPEP
jgi:tetratricopeptide (TPR) repeat protein